MLLINPVVTLERPEILADEAASLASDLAERGVDEASLERVGRLTGRAAELALSLREELPAEAVALIDAARRMESALRLEGADQESALLDALDDLHIALLAAQENDPVSDTRPLRDVVTWMTGELGVSQEQLAAAANTPARTLQRWLAGTTPAPAAMEQRLRLILKGLNEVRFALRGSLALSWLNQPLPGAGNRPPIDLVDQPEAFRRAVMATRF